MAKHPTVIPEDRKQVLVSIFSHAIGIADILGRYDVVGPESFDAIRKELRILKETLEPIGKWIHKLPQSVRLEVEAIGSIINNAECNIGYSDVCLSLLNSDLKIHGEHGWREVLRITKPSSISWAKSARQVPELRQDDSEQDDFDAIPAHNDTFKASAVTALTKSGVEQNAPTKREWPNPEKHTTAKFWTRKDGTVCLSTKTDSSHDGTVEFAPMDTGQLTYQMRFMQLMCLKFPNSATLAEVIEQVYHDDWVKAKQNQKLVKSMLHKLRTLVSDIRNKKLTKVGLNPSILPSLSIEAAMETGIALRLAHLHRMDDKELDEADKTFL